jgi:hypothetical protein
MDLSFYTGKFCVVYFNYSFLCMFLQYMYDPPSSPRCTRQVHAHGVCGNCGEVAFQCRKCRHINYDSLDAFLCVECGYCTAGSFSYELTAGIALNAIAILDEDW